MRGISLDTWVTKMDNEKMCCDELGLMGLCKLYRRHSVVLTKSRLWSTIDTEAPFNLLELLNQCNICFVYLGNLKFESLQWKPRNPTPKPVQPSFEIVEEYTLDDQEATASDTSSFPVSTPTTSNVKSVPQHTAASKNDSGNITSEGGETYVPDVKTSLLIDGVGTVTLTDSPLECGTDSTKLESDHARPLDTVGMSGFVIDDTKFYPNDDNPEHDLLLSAYPWTKPACVNLRRISPETIDKWTVKPIPDVATPPPLAPVITHSKGYGLRSKIKQENPVSPAHIKQELNVQTNNKDDVSTAELIEHAESLLTRAKQLVGKPD